MTTPASCARHHWAVVALVLLAGVAGAGAVVGALAAFHEEIVEPRLSHLDQVGLSAVHGWASPPLTAIMLALILLGAPLPIALLALGVTVLLWRARRCIEASACLAAVVGAVGLDLALKQWFHRQRPDVAWALGHESSFSFPSGHAMLSMAIFGGLAYTAGHWLWRRRTAGSRWAAALVGAAVALLIGGIGLSRVYLGVHYPSDVLGGFLGGSLWLGAVIVATEALPVVWRRPPRPRSTPETEGRVIDDCAAARAGGSRLTASD